jgi:hypothetical protein
MSKLKRLILFWLLKPPLEKQCPARLSLFGKGSEKNNCYNVFLLLNGKRNIIIQSIDSKGIRGKEYDGNSFSKDCVVPFESLSHIDIEILHFYKSSRVSYKKLFDFFIWEKTKIFYLIIYGHILTYKCSQFIYNRRRLVTIQRMKILEVLVNNHIEQAGKGIGLIDIITRLYSIKWVGHPDGDQQQNKISLYLDSLVDSGELTKNGANYHVTLKAISTLEKYEEDDKRNRTQTQLQWMMISLTIILAVTAVIQAGIIKIPTIVDLTVFLKK